MSVDLKFTIRYTGGIANESLLDLYDAATSMHGLSKALAITSNALVTRGQVRKRVDKIPNVKFYLHPPKNGSFIELVTIVFESPAVQAIGSSVLIGVFWDFINFTWRRATGKEVEPLEYQTKKILEENEFLEQEIIDALEIPLQQIHRPIQNDRNIEIELKRPRVGTVLKLDRETYDYVNSQLEPEEKQGIVGNVTKYNNLSGIGRFYDDNLGRTISFHSSDSLVPEEINNLSWSLHVSNQLNGAGKIVLTVDEIKSNTGQLKRYIIKNAEKLDNHRQNAG
ncbi:hypothetical protein KRE40_12880 [Elizabethkingia meningoseptica]|uniref:DUF7946 domain-containing protein n=1 Tax=Elizabethkingia meningoseptica TaxID=238 RepID=UPI0023AFF201|nr:hypothetical protein [Elizabethkingia meningoseptica]MDE5439006.1 hypothetical protein [Elizabethkingia meningoseptica]MDE5509540.1 hypothetical protein [Elizabethkingia meningoseptica]MDE5516865.1 hypothetical protein [Elizabethkingia meningoseptica]MDE5531105.1 hypothetical protein [Elizabethkingia meningoseptica]MDE5534541.1 hypothetical protein [Elizabethkingia meningoseptica]